MTLKDVVDRVAQIKELEKYKHQPDGHIAEDCLYLDLLRAIASGKCTDPQACAAEAVKVSEFSFPRWHE